ncbi:cytochrome b/b6 domain-containing protein [Calothrix sp. NIES-3974]|uniref:cytochrome b/b6 domain-containing protein n=1 Tax=Calothrix sp. NIES-3974 TaxID=2005462 RepID=UPI000BBC7783|nr:cytochrome b/b6 domain-containing protein [Calothrix sp. NIES-3974]
MPQTKPYQPLIFRLLHGVNAILIIFAAITGFLVYDSWDGRFGGLGITRANRELIDYHGTFGFLIFFVALPLFLIYCIKAGRSRLIQGDTLKNWQQIGKPIWWLGLQRITNTLMLISALFAAISGKFMDENWLPLGDLTQIPYYIHLLAWLTLVITLALHILMSAKVGGSLLLLSMFDLKYRPQDSPKYWKDKLVSLFRKNN